MIFILLLSSCSQQIDNDQQNEYSDAATRTDKQASNPIPSNYGINPNNLPYKVTDKDINSTLGSLETIYGFSGKNVSNKDFTQLSLEKISEISFDTDTIWCEGDAMPKGYSPSLWLETSKDPGLQIKKLQKEGHTGKGISVAIIDKPILSSSNEFNKDNFKYIPVGTDVRSHFHGMSCAAILAGQNCGVAPDVKLYYFAVPDNGKNFENYSTAIDKIIELNQGLSKKDKIRIVSISDGLANDDERWENWNKTLQKANDEGIIVIYSNNVGDKFAWGGCPPYKDRNNVLNYEIAKVFIEEKINNKSEIIIPADYRTTANNQSNDGYTYYGVGGWSWAIPYFAGLCVLGLEINPHLTYEQMQKTLEETKSKTDDGYYVINPVDYIVK
jgi:subtilisin family serine protease